MKKMYIKKEKFSHHIPVGSWKYWMAVCSEICGIILWSIALQEIYFKNKTNPAVFLLNLGGLFFVIGSFIYVKCIRHN